MAAESPEITLVLLPGLDGSGDLFRWFTAVLPPGIKPAIVLLRANDYSSLEDEITPILPNGRRFVLLGESFSGPLALRLAAERPAGLVAVVLVASFATRPLGWISALASRFVHPGIFRLGSSRFLLQHLVLGDDPPAALIEATLKCLHSSNPVVLAARCRAALTVDATDEMMRCPVPLLYLAGTRDKLVSPRIVWQLKRLKSDLEIASIEAPHFILQRAPEAAVAAIVAFLTRMKSTGT
jgi:pimeloyl-[acyl-carrier protein] methyl ester esterase